MKKKNKKILIIVVSIVFLVVLFGIIYFIFNSRNENSLTLEENQWIESNKQNVVDVAIINDLPVISYDGKGIVYDYLNFISEKNSLKFNVIPYKMDSTIEYEYKMDIVSNPSEKDIILLEDNLVLITSDNSIYNNIDDITNLKLGVQTLDKELIGDYFSKNNIELIEYTTYNELKQSLTLNSETTPDVNGIIIPKTIMTKEIIENNYKISFHIDDLKKYIILNLDGQKELNNILKKYFNVWKEDNYEISYNSSLLNQYFNFKNISDIDQKKLKSKSYVYGFIDYGIYNHLVNNKISGFNNLVLKGFKEFSNLSITYTRYNSISKLNQDFNNNKVDFMLNLVNMDNNNVYNTVGVFNKQLAIISGLNNTDVINGLYSLKGKEVLTIKDSYFEKNLINNGVKVKLYNNFTDLITEFSDNDIAIVDLYNYNFYKTTSFKNSKINYLFKTEDKYNYILNDIDNNNIFKDVFDFYLNYTSINKLISVNYSSLVHENINFVYILVLIVVILGIYIIFDIYNHMKYIVKSIKKRKKTNLTKEEKIKYIDQLTSLKNRAYLNSKIELWDESEIYPQSIIIIDLNNISYINDNYGREEGDKVITEAANILIQHQMQNTEIIRTDGNEFLIYLVGYGEKQIISYLRRLNKELKGLSHGFGAASGYSIINDAIKTVDDAVNEATIDMKNNKEDIDY